MVHKQEPVTAMAGWSGRWLLEAGGVRPARWTLPLVPLSWLGRAYATTRNWRYDRGWGVVRPRVPVVSVGNLTIGGTNKTPMVDWLLARLGVGGRRLGVVSRGYGRDGASLVFRGRDAAESALPDVATRGLDWRSPREWGDEPGLLARRHPEVWIAVGPDRVAGVEALDERGVDVVVADDAFQHRRLGRCFDLVLIDAYRPWGSGRMLPAGILREPIGGLARADAIVVTRLEEATEAARAASRRRLAALVPEEHVHHALTVVEDWWVLEGPAAGREVGGPPPGLRVAAATGIARPESFFRTLEDAGVEILATRVFRDHARISGGELDGFESEAGARGAEAFACTEKDLGNLERLPRGRPLWVPRIGLHVERTEELVARIDRRILQGAPGAGR